MADGERTTDCSGRPCRTTNSQATESQTGRSDDRVTDVRVTDDRVTNDRGTNDRGTGVQVIRCKYKTTMMFCFKTVSLEVDPPFLTFRAELHAALLAAVELEAARSCYQPIMHQLF